MSLTSEQFKALQLALFHRPLNLGGPVDMDLAIYLYEAGLAAGQRESAEVLKDAERAGARQAIELLFGPEGVEMVTKWIDAALQREVNDG